MDTNTLIIGILAGALGTGYFVSGKARHKMVPMLSGFLLCIYPFFTDNIWILCIVGILLLSAPIFFKF